MTEGSLPTRDGRRVTVAILVPLIMLGAAMMTGLAVNYAGQLGPLNRATISWIVVVPLIVLTPVVAGFLWRSMTRRAMLATALVVAAIAVVTVAAFAWLSIATTECSTARIISNAAAVIPALFIGLGCGVPIVTAGYIVARTSGRAQPMRVVAAGIGGGIVAGLVSLGIAALVLLTLQMCARP
jgi:hypothetical protein